MVKHFVLCWEIGADLGHISQMATVAHSLRQRGHRVSVVLKDVCHAQRYFAGMDIAWYQAPQPAGFRSAEAPLNHADLLRESGYDNPARLAGLLQAWRNLFDLLQPDAVISEAAPTAALAARYGGLRCICLDNGFFVPPPSNPMPALRSWQPVGHDELLRREARALQVINSALQQLNLPPLQHFAQLFEVPTYWLTWPALNHFGNHSPERHLGPIYADSPGRTLDWPAGAGRKVFAYLKPNHPHAIPVLEWCLRRGDRLLAYLPFWPVAELRRLQTLGSISISQEPLDLGNVLDECAWVVCHAGVGTVSRAMRAGKPLLLLPSHVEQIRTARALTALQLAVVPQTDQTAPGLRIDTGQLEQARLRAADYAQCLNSPADSLARLMTVLEAEAGRMEWRQA